MKKTINLLLLMFIMLAVSGCGTTKTSQPSLVVPANQAATSSTVSENVVNVDIKDFTFTPDFLTVKPGTTVIWTNNDPTPHRIKSDTFNSDKLSQGQTFSFTFNNSGTFVYICSIHTSMGGQIIVQ